MLYILVADRKVVPLLRFLQQVSVDGRYGEETPRRSLHNQQVGTSDTV